MKVMTPIANTAVVGLVVVVVVLFVLNYLVIVSDGQTSYGIVEEWLFGRSAASMFSRSLKSDSLRKWDDSSSLSERIASVLTSKGLRLLSDPALESERASAAAMARTAYDMASSIPHEYLAASNSELAEVYDRDFVAALKLWAEGLAEGRQDLVAAGVEHYNAFIAWIQSKKRSDFRSMK